MGTTTRARKYVDPCTFNNEDIVLWFDDLGTGNEQYRFLSNFYIGEPLTLPGVTWEALLVACHIPETAWDALATEYDFQIASYIEFISGEHAFAAMKFWGTDFDHFVAIVNARDEEYVDEKGKTQFISACNHAKSLGRSRSHPLRADWEIVKLDVMAAITRAKYAQDREEAAMLLDTGDRLLVEGTFWADEVWGVDLRDPLLPGRNWLGSLLMMRRAELRASVAASENAQVQKLVDCVGVHNAVFSL